MLAAPIISCDAMFTPFKVYSFGISFSITIIFEGIGGGEGRLPIGQ
jgi:hypothetical protein